MEMQQIRHFVAVVQHGNIRRAAEALNITQPALTRSIKNLEQNLQVELLARSSRGVAPTLFGEVFFDYAQRTLNDTRRIAEQLQQLRGGAAGELRVGVASNYVDQALSVAVAQLMQQKPGITISIKEDFFSKLIEHLISGEIDVMISLCPEGFSHNDLTCEELSRVQAQVYCRAGHPLLRRGRKASLRELQDATWATLGLKEIDRFFDRVFATVGPKRPAVAFRSNSVRLLKDIIATTDTLVLFQAPAMADELASGRCVELPSELGTVSAQAVAFYRDRLGRAPLLDDFLKRLRAVSRDRRARRT
jgi:DNA-binding transcriptional LysR family regulator